MRALVVSIWVFINLVFFGMCGYMYLLWSQYWLYMERQAETSTSTYDQQIYFYNRGYYPNNSVATLSSKTRQKHSVLKENSSVTLIKNSKPRFPNLQPKDFELDSKKNMCLKNDSLYICERKTAAFKEDIINELRKVFIEEGNVLRVGKDNPYNVQYRGKKGNFLDKSPKKVLCQLYDVPLKTIKRDDVENHLLKDYIPKRALFQNKRFHSCAVVASAGSLKDSKLGSLIEMAGNKCVYFKCGSSKRSDPTIKMYRFPVNPTRCQKWIIHSDSHDLVLRFNNAPTEGFEEDVGAKTTIRLLNSQVVTKSQFNFLNWKLFKNVTLVAWDPSNYSSTIEEWLEKPEFNLFPNYIAFRKNDLKSRAFILNPQSVWDIWDFLQDNSPSMLRRNPPSSGFLGIRLLLPFCSFIDVFEYVPSTRVSRRCHYYDPEDNPSCTFGVWHPLAAEKLLTYYINTVDDRTVFQTGYVRIPGLRSVDCA